MIGLPKNTELNKQLPKKAIYAKFHVNTAKRDKINSDIARISIVNEISPTRINIAAGKNIKGFYVLLLTLKKREFDKKSIITVSKLIPQNMLMILEYDGQARLAVYYSKLMLTEWQKTESFSIKLKGLDLDTVWKNIIVQIGKIQIRSGNTLDEQIIIDEKKVKLQKKITRLEKRARTEKQPKKKFTIVSEVQSLKKQLREIS